MTGAIHESAPAKINLVLQVGDAREDGLHELCSLFASLDLADELTIEPRDRGGDLVVCAAVTGPNLATRAIAELRAELDGDLPPLAVTIDKRIPVAAGLGGGSADAAAVLRAANAIAGDPLDVDALRAVGARIGADVPSQIDPRHAIVTGAGEHVEPVRLDPFAVVLLPQDDGLSTADVYREADRLRSTRARLEPDTLRRHAGTRLPALVETLENDPALGNDLEPAALTLRPQLAGDLRRLRGVGARAVRITGSGPTAFGIFPDRSAAQPAAVRLSSRALVAATRDKP
jgi:4-diphosphocytidyl-2-C-methyl-D-erythritol kinase